MELLQQGGDARHKCGPIDLFGFAAGESGQIPHMLQLRYMAHSK